MKPCPHCGGTGHVRSDSSVALMVVRAIEEFLLKDSRNHIVVKTPASTALYVLNHKRSTLTELEARFGLTITVEVDETVGAQHYAIVRGAVAEKPVGFKEQQFLPAPVMEEEEDSVLEIEEEEEAAQPQQNHQQRNGENGDEGGRKRRRRRRRRGGRDREHDQNGAPQAVDQHPAGSEAVEAEFAATEDDTEVDGTVADGEDAAVQAVTPDAGAPDTEEGQAKKRRRGKRGGKRNRRDGEGDESPAEGAELSGTDNEAEQSSQPEAASAETAEEAVVAEPAVAEPEAPVKKPRRASRSKKAVAAEPAVVSETEAAKEEATEIVAQKVEEPIAVPVDAEPVAIEPNGDADRASRRKASDGKPSEPVVSSSEGAAESAGEQPKRGGWWQRRSFF